MRGRPSPRAPAATDSGSLAEPPACGLTPAGFRLAPVRGQKAAASRISSGPVFGSVPWPVSIPPKPCASTQMTAAVTTASIRTGRVAAGTSTPTAMTAKRAARTIAAAVPWVPIAAAAARSIEAIQPGSPAIPAVNARFQFEGGIAVEANAAVSLERAPEATGAGQVDGQAVPDRGCAPPIPQEERTPPTLESLRTLHPLGQIRNSFILAVNEDGLWIIDQHVAHERVLFERILRQRAAQQVESQRLLMPLVIELTPAQQAIFSDIADELARNGFEAEPFGSHSVAVKVAPAGVDAAQIEHIMNEIFEQLTREEQAINLEAVRTRIAASIACHAAIKVNMPLEQNKMEWLLAELAKTEHPMTCPHGRPVVLRYSMQDIQKAFKRI